MSGVPLYYGRLVKLCRNRGCCLEDARDIVQEAHLRLFEYQRSARVWDVISLLRRIVINLAINHFHRVLSKPFAFESAERLDRRGILVDPVPGPERTVAAEQQLDRVVALISAVSRRTCQIFIAQRGGYSYEEIAKPFAVKPRTVEKHVATAAYLLQEVSTGNHELRDHTEGAGDRHACLASLGQDTRSEPDAKQRRRGIRANDR